MTPQAQMSTAPFTGLSIIVSGARYIGEPLPWQSTICLPSKEKFKKQFAVIFNWVSKEIWDCIGFTSEPSVIGLGKHPLPNQKKNQTNRDLVTPDFPRFRPYASMYFDLWLALCSHCGLFCFTAVFNDRIQFFIYYFMKAIFNSPCILFAIPKSVSLIIGGRSTSGFSANKRFSGFKSYKIRGKQFD